MSEEAAGFLPSLKEPTLSRAELFPLVFNEPWHSKAVDEVPSDYVGSVWMAADRRRTTRGILALSLNIGVDPPDVVKRNPCAYLECWIDPISSDPEKSVKEVGDVLVKQYDYLQPRAKYIPCGDPHPETIESECKRARRSAGVDRVLFHFNGHGVPACTSSGEIWVFNEDYTQYLPVSMYELMHWLMEPSIYVFDANGAGHLVEWYRNALIESAASTGVPVPSVSSLVSMSVLFASCGKNEFLPTNPDLPGDVFTSCLTTPIRMALVWHIQQRSLLSAFSDLESVVGEIPGQLENRRTPLGELNWIFTAVTDAMAYSSCTPELFQKLFREDTLLAGLCRNFLLAQRVMRSSHVTPVSFPALPEVSQHALWLTWDLEVERCVAAHAMQKTIPKVVSWKPSTFFHDQLSALDIWSAQGDKDKASPAALPCLLQALLSQAMREKALWSLARYMDLGPWAVGRALTLGVFPYLLKLLKSGSRNLRAPLMLVWGKVIALEPKTIPELGMRETLEYFLHTLASGSSDDNQRVMACFVLAQCCAEGDVLREMCLNGDFLGLISVFCAHTDPRLRVWCAMGAGFAWKDNEEILMSAIQSGCASAVEKLRFDLNPRVRAAAAFAFGAMGSGAERRQLKLLRSLLNDGCPLVRREVMMNVYFAMKRDPVDFRKVAMSSLQAELEEKAPSLANDHEKVIYELWSATRHAANFDPNAGVQEMAFKAANVISSMMSGKLLGLAEPTKGARIGSRGGLISQNSSNSLLSSLSNKSLQDSKYPKGSARSPRSLLPLKRSPVVGASPNNNVPASAPGGGAGGGNAAAGTGVEGGRGARRGTIVNSSSTSPSDAVDMQKDASPPPSPREQKGQKSRGIHRDGSGATTTFSALKGRETEEVPKSLALKFELSRIHDPVLKVEDDPSDPHFIARENLQKLHTHSLTDVVGKLKHHKKRINEIPHDRERLRLKSIAEGKGSPITAMCFAPGPPELLVVARGNLLVERKEELSSSNGDQAAEEFDASIDGTQSLAPLRWWESGAEVSSIVPLNGHYLPLWAVGSIEGAVRIYGRPCDESVAPLVSSWMACPLLGTKQLKLAWDGSSGCLHATGSSQASIWDAVHEVRKEVFDLPSSGTAVSVAFGSPLASVGMEDGSVALLDARLGKSPVHLWKENNSRVLGSVLCSGAAQDWNVLVSGSTDGNVLFWDLRAPSHSCRSLKVSLGKSNQQARAMSAHPFFGEIAMGTAEGVSIFGSTGKLLSSVKYFDSGSMIGGVEHLSFHPFSTSLACGLTNGDVLLLST